MSKKKKYNLQEVAGIVESEGIGYAVQYYMSEDSISDPELATLWKEAREKLEAIDKKLQPYYED